MNTNNHLGFITSKIEQLETAVLHNYSSNVLNIRSTIIKTLQVDATGHIWFTIIRPKEAITEFEDQFPVALNYYKKNSPFFLNIFGIARIINDPEELCSIYLDTWIKADILKDKVLLSVKIVNVNYYEKGAIHKSSGWLSKCWTGLVQLFSPDNNYYSDIDFQSDRNYA